MARALTRFFGLLAVVVLPLMVTASASANHLETREYLLGDVDDFSYDGPGSVDDVYVDADWMDYVVTVDPPDPEKGFDVLDMPSAPPAHIPENHNVPFTFLYNLGPAEEVVGANLLVALRATDSLVTTDGLFLDGPKPDNWYGISGLGWLPIPQTGTSIRTVDLGNVLGDSYLPDLQDGKLNVLIRDDVGIDYAKLTLTVESAGAVVPEPLTVAGLAMGSLVLARYLQKRS